MTNSEVPLIQDIDVYLKNGKSVPIKSGQQARMWPKLYRVNWPDKLKELSGMFPDNMKDPDGTLKGGFCPSLKEMQIPFQEYSLEEMMMYKPTQLKKRKRELIFDENKKRK